jgi:hypothetical protein
MSEPQPFTCGAWAGRLVDACEADYGRNVHGYRNGDYYNTHGCTFRQLPQDIPWLAPFYSTFELNFNSIPFVCWTAQNWNLALAICGAYLALVAFGVYVMQSAKPFDLRNTLRFWNIGLSLFSLVGFARTLPHLLYYIFSDPQGAQHGFYSSRCKPAETSYGQGAAGLWTMLFIFSKVPELVDTLFVVLRKKELIFLHWYHHVTVLLYCWHSYMTRSSAGLYFITMNYGVHAIMYFYFALDKTPLVKFFAPFVTALQISQMVVGMIVCASVYIYQQTSTCDMTPSNFIAGIGMYFSYFLLFAYFALEKYISPKSKGSEKKDTKKSK